MKQTIALFGEAEKGAFHTPHRIEKLPQVLDLLGNPPPDSQGISFAIQSILYNRTLLFFRVEVEGFSASDYHSGLKYLAKNPFHVLCLPGVGDPQILKPFQHLKPHILLTTQHDLYDFLTSH